MLILERNRGERILIFLNGNSMLDAPDITIEYINGNGVVEIGISADKIHKIYREEIVHVNRRVQRQKDRIKEADVDE